MSNNLYSIKIFLRTTISPESDIATETWLIYKHHLPVSTNRLHDAYHQWLVSLLDMNLRTDQGSLAILDRIYQAIEWQHHVVELNRHD